MMPPQELLFDNTASPSRQNVQSPFQYAVRVPHSTTSDHHAGTLLPHTSSECHGFGKMDVDEADLCSSAAATSSLCELARYSTPLCKSHWYISRGSGILTPLVPVDELPQDIKLQGAPRQISASQTQSMNYVGHMPHNGAVFELENIVAPMMASTHAGFTHSQDTSRSKYTALSQRNEELREPPEGYGCNAKPRQRSTWDMTSLQRTLSDAIAAGEKYPILQAHQGANTQHQDVDPNYQGGSPNPQSGDPSCESGDPKLEGLPYVRQRPPPPSGVEPDIRKKRYCTYWLRNGECDFIQQGCLYKHELPSTAEEWSSIGFQHVPNWIVRSAPEWAKRISLTLKRNSNKQSSPRSPKHRRGHSERVEQKKSPAFDAPKCRDISNALPSPLRIDKRASDRSKQAENNNNATTAATVPALATGPTVNENDLLIDFDSTSPPNPGATLNLPDKSLDRDTLPSRQRPHSTPIFSGAHSTALPSSQYHNDRYPYFPPSHSPQKHSLTPVPQSLNTPILQGPSSAQPTSVAAINVAPPQHRSLFSPPPTQPTLTQSSRLDGASTPPHTFDEIFHGKKPKTMTTRESHVRDDGRGFGVDGCTAGERRPPAKAMPEGLDRNKHAAGTAQRRNRRGVLKKARKEGKRGE